MYRSHASRIHVMISFEWYTIEDCIIYYAGLEPMHVCALWCGHQSFTSYFHPLSSVSLVFAPTVASYVPLVEIKLYSYVYFNTCVAMAYMYDSY